MEAPEELLLGSSGAVAVIKAQLAAHENGDQPVVIDGPRGSGKEVLARAIHRNSHVAQGPFTSLRSDAATGSELDALLFGYRGPNSEAAHSDMPHSETAQRGVFEVAAGGTLFLDMVSSLRPELQTKLASALKLKRVERLGDNLSIAVRSRVIASTPRPLSSMVERGDVRVELYEALQGLTLSIPPLCQRRADIPRLAQHFLSQAAPERRFSPKALQCLRTQPWPGNVRELREVVKRCAAGPGGAVVDATTVQQVIFPTVPTAPPHSEESSLRQRLRSFEKTCVLDALEQCGGVVQAAAQLCGESRAAFYDRMQRLDIVERRPASSVRDRHRVLFVDDDATARRSFHRNYRRVFDVTVARDGADALEQLLKADKPFDHVLCDLVMDDMSGDQVYEQLVQHDPDAARRFVLVTGNPDGELAATVASSAGAPMLEKPLRRDSLLQLLELRGRSRR